MLNNQTCYNNTFLPLINIEMGLISTLINSITGIKVVLFLLILLAIAVLYILNQRREKQQLKQLLSEVIHGRQVKEQIKKIQYQTNQVYLKSNKTKETLKLNEGNEIYKIVITGGPCGGKSTSLKQIQQDLAKRGFRVFSIPQIPTLVVQAGGMILMSNFSLQERIKFQSQLIKLQIEIEDYFVRLALMSKTPSVIICDRGTCDPAAYVTKQQFQAIMDEEGWTWATLRDKRYDRVLHLVTAALGAEQFYTRSNNSARSQGLQLARELDKKTLDAWTGHPHITVCPNIPGQSFDKKLQVALRGVYKTIGLQLPDNRYEKFLISKPLFPQNIKIQSSEIQQIFLVNQNSKWSEDSLIKRGKNNSCTYKHKLRSIKNEEGQYAQQIRKPITALQYIKLKQERKDDNYKITVRQRLNFIFESIHYRIDIWKGIYGQQETFILRFSNPTEKDANQIVPSWLKIKQNVRQNPKYQLRNIAKK